MRIIRGLLKSRRFTPPKGFPSRPTTDFAKEGLFNLLEHRFSLANLKILDLCAGTGNISLEFISREAGHVTAVDQHPVCVRFIRKMVEDISLEKSLDVSKSEVVQFLKKTPFTFDIIFADPPYDATFYTDMHTQVFERNLLNKGGLFIVEHGKQTNLSNLAFYENTRNWGNVYFSFFTIPYDEE